MIFTKATEAGMDEIMICEDDVIFPEDFSSQLDSIQHKLRSKNNWSIFSGVMADAGRIKVHDCEQIEDKKLIRINHMMSMVFNIYNRSMFPHICKWNEQNRDDQTNTIDRYLESKDLAVYVQIPFMVGHKEELRSTIWGFSNTQYATMISNTQEKLEELAQNYLDSLPS